MINRSLDDMRDILNVPTVIDSTHAGDQRHSLVTWASCESMREAAVLSGILRQCRIGSRVGSRLHGLIIRLMLI